MDKIVSILTGPLITNYEAMGALMSSLLVMVIMMIIAVIVRFLAARTDPLKKPHGLIMVFEMFVEMFDNMVAELMGPKFDGFGGYIMTLAGYIFLSFMIGLTGLPAPMANLAMPLSIALITFILIHATAFRFNKLKYFKRYIDPMPIFLPVNLLSMWSPLLSLSFRLFGNAIAGWTLMSVVYYALENASAMLFSGLTDPAGLNTIFIAPFITPVLHAYFDVISGVIQTLVFIMLTMLFIANEAPEEDEVLEKLAV